MGDIMDKKMKKGKKQNSFLARLSKANEESFGNGKLECCDLKEHQKPRMTVKDSCGGENAKN